MNKKKDELTLMLESLSAIRNCCFNMANGKWSSNQYEEYEKLRSYLLTFYPRLTIYLPDWILDYSHGSEFWRFLSLKSGYANRRNFINGEFDRVENSIKSNFTANVGSAFLPKLESISNMNILHYWNKCLERKHDDPEGVITASKTMIETVLKHILDKRSISYKKSDDIMTMYGLVAKELNLSPQNHSDKSIKQILSGCFSLIGGIAAFRNEFSDAHGKSSAYQVPTKVHSDFIINISGGLSLFLLELSE